MILNLVFKVKAGGTLQILQNLHRVSLDSQLQYNRFSFGAQQKNLPLIFKCTPIDHNMSCDQCDYGNTPFATEGGGGVCDCMIL